MASWHTALFNRRVPMFGVVAFGGSVGHIQLMRRHLNVTQRALSVTQRALSVTQRGSQRHLASS
jgi:chromate transport protein ChrA